jgi:type I restriction enzyme R subunit
MTASGRDEAQTRIELIDTQLARAGWSGSRRTLVEEFLVKQTDPRIDIGNSQFADYVLLGPDRKPVAVVEAKRTSRCGVSRGC